jgi:predicted kinase
MAEENENNTSKRNLILSMFGPADISISGSMPGRHPMFGPSPVVDSEEDDNEVEKDDFVSSIPGLKEKLIKTQETKTPEVSVSSPKKTTAAKVEEPAAETTEGKYSEVSNLNLENYKSNVEITKEDVEKGEGDALKSIIPKLKGLGFDFDESIPGLDAIKIIAPADENGNRAEKEFLINQGMFGFDLGFMNKNVAKDINKWVKENVSSNNINVDVYGKVWNYANSKKISYKNKNKDFKGGEDWAIGKPEDKTTSEELGDHVKSMYHEIMSSENLPGVDKIIKEINDKLDIYSVNTVKTLQKKYNTNDPDQYKKAQQEFETIISKKHHELYNDSKELKNIENGVWKALESRFGGVLEDKMRAEAENAALPSWVTSFESPFIRSAYVTAAIKFPKAIKEVNILHQGIFLDEAKKELSELEKDPKGTYYAPTGFNEQGIEIKVPAGSNYDRIQFLKKDIADINKNIAFKIAEQDEYQKKLNVIRTPSIFGKDISDPDLTLDEWKGMLGDQTVQMISAVLSLGTSTYVQEAGAAGIEIIKLEAAKKAFPIKDFLPSTFDQIEGKNLGFSTVSDEDAKRMHFEYALEQFDKLPLEDIVVNGRLKPGRAALMLDILNKGEANLNPAMAVGAINSGLDLVSNFFVISKGLKAFAPRGLGRDLLKGQFDKFLTNGYKELGKGILASSFVEFATETAQEGASITGVGAATGYWGNYEKNLKRFAEAGGQALLTTGPLVGAGKITTTVSKEITAKIQAVRDPNATRNAINKEKSMWNEKYEDGEITLDERDDIYTELEANEDIVNNTKFKNLDIDAKGIVIRNLKAHKRNETQITKLQEENKKIKDNNQGGLGNSSTLQNEIKIYNLQKDNQSLAQKNLNEVFKNDYIENGVRFAQWINEQTEGDLANKKVMTFDTVEQFKSWLDSSGFKEIDGVWTKNGKNIGYFDSDGVYVDPINNVINGTVNGANFASDNLAIMVNENVKANIDKYSDWSSSNVVHHEVFHFITEGMNTSELQSIRQAIDKELKASTDPKIKLAMLYHAEKMALYTGDQRTREYNDEYFAVLSDALNAIEVSDLSLETGITWNNIGKVLGGFFQQKTKSGFDFGKFDAQNTLEFIKKYNSFNGKSRITLPKMPRGRTNVQPEEKKDVENLNFTKAKSSKLVVSKEEYVQIEEDVKSIGEIYSLDGGKQVWDEFGANEAIREIKEGKYFDNLIASKYKGKAVPKDFVSKVYSELTNHIKNFNPEKNNNLFAYINAQVENKAGNVYNREYKVSDEVRSAVDIDAKTKEGAPIIQVETEILPDFDEATKSELDKKDVKLRDLRNFDVYLDNSFGNELAIAEVNGILSRFENSDISLEKAKSLMTEVTLKDIRAALSESIPKIAKDKASGITKPTPEYESWIRSEYDEIVQSLDIKTIRKYKFFEATVTGKKDYKNIDPLTGKVSNFIKPTQVNTTNKREYIRYFLEGKTNDLVERRTALIRRIAERKASVAVDNYIVENSNNIKAVVLSAMSTLSTTTTIKKNEQTSFDSVQFSKVVRGFSDAQAVDFYKGIKTFANKINLANVADRAMVEAVVKEVWGGLYSDAIIKDLSKNFYKLLNRYATIDRNHTNLNTKPEQQLNEYLYSNLKAAELELNLAEFLQLKDSKGRLMKLSVLFDDTNRLKNQRSAILDFGKNLIKKYGEKQALMMMIHGSGMYSTSAKISRGNHTEINGDLTKIEGKTADFGSQRYQSFAGKKDWNVNVMQVLFPNISLTKSNKVSKYQNVTNEKGVVEKIDTTLLAESSKEGVKDRNFTARKAQAKLSELFVRDIAQYYKDRIEAKNPSLDKKDFAMLMMSMASNMQSPLKRAANLKYIYKDKKGKKYKGKLRYEHMIPTNYMVMRLADAFMGNKSNVDLDALFEEYTVAIIPVTMDNIMEEMGFVDVMPIGFAAGQSSRVRYYNMSTYGHPDLYAIESIDPKDNGQVYGEAVANLKITTFKKGNKFSKALGEATIISRTVNPAKGISVLDFDDTLATTKSGVRYTLPNPDGLPQPKKKVIFMAGGPGSGKSNVINQLGLKEQGFKVVNQDISLEWLMKNHGMPTDMREFTPEQASEFGKLSAEARGIALKKRIKYQGEGDGVVIDGTGASLNVMKKNIQDFKDKGYDVQMIFVETSQETALSRNKARKERSLRTGIVIKTHDSVQANKEAYKELFGERFAEVNTDNLKQGDAMPTDVVNKVNDFTSGYIKGRLNAGEYATKGEELKQQGAEFDFSEFNQVVEGKTAPLFNKAMKLQEKFTSKDMFVLTARPAESNQAIFEFLQANGLKIPMENIIGLGSSASSDKALWIAGKVGEGYNDFYFADDILENVQAVSDMLEQFDVKSKVQQAKRDFVLGDPKVTKLLDEKSMNDVKDVDGLANPGVYSNVKFSKSHRAEYENTVAKNRPDLSSKEVTATIDKMFDYIDGLDVPNKRKYEQITTKWLATSNIKLPEDSYKIQQAVEIAELKKEDIFSYKNPNEIIEKYAGTIKVKPISPVGIKEFTRATGFNDPITTEYGIVEYEVEETREAQQKVRDIVNTHWGPNSNPWCITKIDKDGNLSEDAWRDWTSYGKGPKRIVFQNGKLLAMKANYEYWGKMNKHSEGPIIQVKEGNVTNTTELVVGDGGIVDPIIRETRTVSKDGNTVTTNIFENSQDGYAEGTTIVENRIKGVKTKETRFDPDGSKVSTQEFNKKGKPTTSYQFNPNGKVKSINGHLQQQAITEAGLDVNAREDADIDLTNELVVRVGDIIENNYTETETNGTTTDYFYGRALIGGQVMEIGFESKTGLDLADVTKTINGKTRLDIGKVIREVDPNVKGLPKTGVKFSKGISKEFNDIIEQSTGVGSEKVFSDAQAKIRGNKRRFDNIVPYSVQDLMGLLYNFVGRGKAGEQHMEFFKKALIDPFARAINELNQSKQSSASDYSNLTKAFPNVKKKLNKEIEGGDYTYDQAIRVYLWNKAGFEVPGLSKRDLNALDSIVKNDPELQAFADTLGLISKKEEGYAKPGEYWLVENIASDLLSDGSIGDARSEFLAEWQQNADEMFSKENLNKIQAIYGNKFREALEDILYRMKHGTNRPTGSSRLTNNFMNWINNSTGAIMFFNMRSALLQTLSTTNYINWTDNNPLKAAAAFANQKQYWSDFSALFNSDFLKQRRSGNQRSINEAELTAAVANSDNKAKAAIAWLLQKGFLPTQIMDSFAISAGGATFYRNRINKYIKEGMSPEQAQEKAFLDFQEITEATQQSARPDMISQQQASPLGRLILSFQNTPMQYARIMNKAARDIVNGRGDQKSNISKIVYYGALQSIIFAALQSAIFAALGDDEEEEFDKKKQRIVDSMVDGWLAGLGVAGKAIGTIERSIKEYLKQKERGFNADHAQTIIQLLGFSPPIGSKVRKIYGAIQTEQFNKGVSEKRGLTLDNPTWSSWGNVIEGFTNVPLGRIANKMLNIDNALDSQNQWWERAALLLGWNTWDLGIKDPDIEAARKQVKEERKVKNKKEKVYKEKVYKEKVYKERD